ncbi:MAG TPA: hypothetical protein VFS01_12240 [Rhizomicrobium sp.]|nr:hypothetical protein [Rhizomicrobium sp.]
MTTEIFTRPEAARFLQSQYGLRVTKASLATMATRGGGPRMMKFGRYAHYRRCDLIEWVRSRCSGLLDSTSTPRNDDTGGLFIYEEDNGGLEDSFDYHNTGDARFDEITRLEENGLDVDALLATQQERFDYRAALNEQKS